MIYWLVNFFTFGFYVKYAKSLELVKETLNLLDKKQYTAIKPFDNSSLEYLKFASDLTNNPMWLFFFYSMRMRVVKTLETSDKEIGNQCVGMLKFAEVMNEKLEEMRSEYEERVNVNERIAA